MLALPVILAYLTLFLVILNDVSREILESAAVSTASPDR